MISDIFNSQHEQKIVGSVGIDGTPQRQDSRTYALFPQNDDESNKGGYELSLSEKGWNILEGIGFSSKSENKSENKDEENKESNGENKEKNGEKERDVSGAEKLSEEDQRDVEELKRIDRKVHTHEQAHLSTAGGYARGGAHYDYVTGPDGNRYANSGHVNIDTSPEKSPEATLRKAATVRRAALAPADPSPADRQIAAEAVKMSQEAQKQLAQERTSENEGGGSEQH